MKLALGLATSILLVWTIGAAAGDWPMWRHDVARSGSTPDELAADLHLHWTREFPQPRPAWPPSQYKLQFDAAWQPVVADGRMFVGSTVNDSITAYATNTGEPLWRFYTDGPVRFAPAVWNGRVYAVSDDGRLYCLNVETGGLEWKYNGGPQQRPILGNGRLVSTWSARGGVVVHEGVAYFAAGIWPSMGVFIHAVDAVSGKRKWVNSDTSSRFVTHPHRADSFGSISPQGALAVSGDLLLVPGGRTLPAVFDRHTGELKHFDFGDKGAGGHAVMVSGPVHIVENQVFRTKDGAAVGPMFAAIASEKRIVGTEAAGDSVVVTTIGDSIKDVPTKDRRGNPIMRAAIERTETARFVPQIPGRVMLVAGRRLYTAGMGLIAAYDLPNALKAKGPVAPVWRASLAGGVESMLAADERLFVVTDDSKVHCFGADQRTPVVFEYAPDEPAAAADPRLVARAGELLQLAPFAGGCAVALDAGEPELLMELVRQSQYHVIAIDADADRIAGLRRAAETVGVYGTHIAGHVRPPFEFNVPPYLADLLIATDSAFYTAGEVAALYDMLRPYGGAACLRTRDPQHKALVTTVRQANLENAQVERRGEWTVIRRVGSLPGAGEWTHQYGDASNSVVSEESRVRAPMGVLWFGGPSNDKVLPRHGHGPTPQVVGGRLFIEGPDMLRCVDVYTGRVWWERDLPGVGAYYDNTAHHPGAGEIGSNYVSLADHLYVVHGKDLLELDARTGETTRRFDAANRTDDDPHWGGLIVSGDVLVVTASPSRLKGAELSREATIPEGATAVIKPHAAWRLLAGVDPPEGWTNPDFDDSGWTTGQAGFGYGDHDDRTVLDQMHGKFSHIAIRAEFDASLARDAEKLTLMINFDDAFIAYLNGAEVLRERVGSGRGAGARRVASHEAEGYEGIEIPDFRRLLRPGKNVLAIEGHNEGADSSDFTLDPYLIATPPLADNQRPSIADAVEPTRYSSSSRELLAFDRHTGSRLWSRPAQFSFRHNTVCASSDTVFCIDGMSPQELALLRRRGVATSATPRLYALDLHSGEVRWSTDEDVFGTFLNYSRQHDVLVQGGSAFRDRARDEVDTGLIAYRGRDGHVLWRRPELQYAGPCLLLGERLITNGSGGFELNLLTGETTGWDYTRMYGCNTAIGCQTMLTFRSGAAGYFDLVSNSGTGNLGGFRSSCTSNLIPADGVLSAPDYTRTCVCAYQVQTSLAFVHMPGADAWTFNPEASVDLPLESVGLNLGAPGDRRDEEGVLWFDYPVVGGPSPELVVTTEPAQPEWFVRHTSLVAADQLGWIAGSGAPGIRKLRWDVSRLVSPGTFRVRLVFADPTEGAAVDGDLTAALNGSPPVEIRHADARAGGVIIRDIPNIAVDGLLELTLTPSPTAKGEGPSLCGVALIAQSR